MNALTTIRNIMQRYIGKQQRQAARLTYAEQIRQTMLAKQRQAAAGSSPNSTTRDGSATSNPSADYGMADRVKLILNARSSNGSRAARAKWWIKP